MKRILHIAKHQSECLRLGKMRLKLQELERQLAISRHTLAYGNALIFVTNNPVVVKTAEKLEHPVLAFIENRVAPGILRLGKIVWKWINMRLDQPVQYRADVRIW